VDLVLPPRRALVSKPFDARDFTARPMLQLAATSAPVAQVRQHVSVESEAPQSRRVDAPPPPLKPAAPPQAPVYSDRTPRPQRPAKPPVKNLLLEVSRGLPTMPERVAAAMQRARQAHADLRKTLSALPPPAPSQPARPSPPSMSLLTSASVPPSPARPPAKSAMAGTLPSRAAPLVSPLARSNTLSNSVASPLAPPALAQAPVSMAPADKKVKRGKGRDRELLQDLLR
jgi:hypothetical protein